MDESSFHLVVSWLPQKGVGSAPLQLHVTKGTINGDALFTEELTGRSDKTYEVLAASTGDVNVKVSANIAGSTDSVMVTNAPMMPMPILSSVTPACRSYNREQASILIDVGLRIAGAKWLVDHGLGQASLADKKQFFNKAANILHGAHEQLNDTLIIKGTEDAFANVQNMLGDSAETNWPPRKLVIDALDRLAASARRQTSVTCVLP